MKKYLPTRTLLLLFLCCTMFTAKAQWVSIPDANFVAFLTQHYPQCMNGNLMDTTCSGIINEDTLQMSNLDIEDMTGIQYFKNLRVLNCSRNDFSVLPDLPTDLTILICSINPYLGSLPALPTGLQILVCEGAVSLGSLPTLPIGLKQLFCGLNSLTQLPVLPDSLLILSCFNNHLQSLPSLPARLLELDCRSNQLNSLPQLPNSLTELECRVNNLTFLPALPSTLNTLVCSDNNLTYLPILPDSLRVLYVSNNPGLNCLPRLGNLWSLYFEETGISCLPNYPEGNVVSTPPLATVPLCEHFNNNGCPAYWNIRGLVYQDTDTGCVFDSAYDYRLFNVKLNLYENGVLNSVQTSLYDGNYSFVTRQSGTFTYLPDTSNIPFRILCPTSNYHTSTITTIDSLATDMDFALTCKPGFDLEARSIVADIIRPANYTTINIGAGDASNFYGAHCAAGVSGVVYIDLSGPTSYWGPAPGAIMPVITLGGTTLTYNIADFGAVDFFNDFNFVVKTDTAAQIGQQICITVSVTPTAGDNNPANNILTQCFAIVNSYDPNDKQVYPAGDIDTAQEWLTYTVRFQNTGTAEAQHIYITDTLDSNLDISTFQLVAYSHQPMVQIKGNAVRFNFPNINLPDSNTNEPESHGYVQYKVKLKNNLPIGTQINNTAFIYFDFNEPVITNTTTNTISLISGISKSEIANPQFEMFPNPAHDVVMLSIDESMAGSRVTITDITGSVVFNSAITHRKISINTERWRSGLYFVTISTPAGGRATKKLVVGR